MRLTPLTNFIFDLLYWHVAVERSPDVTVGERSDPYLQRWYLIPRNRILNIYLHRFLRSDDDRALHDHPWWSASLLLAGTLTEHTIAAGGIHHRRTVRTGQIRIRSARFAHRIEITGAAPVWTLFITGPTLRDWGFHCPRGWVPWQQFTKPGNPGETGPGCEN